MPAGFRLLNEGLAYQVTDDTPNYGLFAIVDAADMRDSLTMPAGSIVAFQPTGIDSMTQHIPGRESGRAFVFAPMHLIPYTRPTSGLIGDIRNLANELMFSVNLYPMSVVDYVEFSGDYSDTPLEVSYTAGRDYAILPLYENIAEREEVESNGWDGETTNYWLIKKYLASIGYKVDGETIRIETTDIQTEVREASTSAVGFPPEPPPSPMAPIGDGYTASCGCFIIDVTGL